jgi:flagellar assembly protein FliH
MTTSLETRVLKGEAATRIPVARLDTELRTQRFLVGGRPDARLADPTLERAFDEVAAQVRAAAQAEGYAVGWAAGLRAATDHVQAAAAEAEAIQREAADTQARSVRTALRALAQAATSLEVRAVTPAAELRDAVLDAAVELTETMLDRELALATEPGLDALRRALDLVPSGRPVTARLHPSDAAAVRDALAAMPAGELGRELLVVADASVEPAGCVVECDASRVDAQLSTALARVREQLAS